MERWLEIVVVELHVAPVARAYEGNDVAVNRHEQGSSRDSHVEQVVDVGAFGQVQRANAALSHLRLQ